MNCILCHTPDSSHFHVVKAPMRDYFLCSHCDLIFMDPAQRLNLIEERQRYDQHNDQGSPGHTAFLMPLVKHIEDHYKRLNISLSELQTLDYGCGIRPVLSEILAGKGMKTYHYDLFYHPNVEEFRRTYNVITSTEVWEHLYNPQEVIEKQLRLLKSQGLLAVMTSSHKGEAAFGDWHYRRDLTHVSFFSEKTMNYLEKRYGLQLLKKTSPYWLFVKV